jgi:hypothetical protein
MKAIHCCYPIIFEFAGFYHELKVLESIQEFKNCTKYKKFKIYFRQCQLLAICYCLTFYNYNFNC